MKVIVPNEGNVLIAEGLHTMYIFRTVPASAIFELASMLENITVPEPPLEGTEEEWRRYEREKEEYVEQLLKVIEEKLESIAEIVIIPKTVGEVKVFKAKEITTAPTAKWKLEEVERLFEYIRKVEP